MKWLLAFILCFPFFVTFSQFSERSKELGIDQLHTNGILYGGGMAIIDFNNDGFEDVLITGGNNSDRLFMNVNGRSFVNVSFQAGLPPVREGISMAALTGDLDNDGFEDIILLFDHEEHIRIYRNTGNGRFEKIRGLPKIENRWSTAGTLIDINQDGLLDIYVVNYVEEVRLIKNDEGELLGYDHICQPNQLFINRGNFEFDEVADQFGADDEGCALATTTIDLNNDGVSDLYVANDFGEWIIPNAALINRFPEEKVENEADALGLDGAIYGMGIDATDYNGDGFPEIYVTNIGPNLYYEWDGSRYLNLANELKIQNDSSLNESLTTGWGALWLDHDNDGREDLVVSNGHITSGHLDPTSFEDPNKLYSRQPDGSFEDVTNELSLGNIDINRGVVSFDYDVDGDLDLLFSSVFLNVDADERNTLFHVNEPNNENHWVTFVLEGSTLSRDAIGAHISLFDKDSKRSKWVKSGVSHASKSSKKIHFGLGENEKVDSIMIRWPGGGSSVYKNFEADQTYYIKEGQTVPLIIGCMDPANSFYNPKANFSMGCKNESYEGCTDRKASNYNPEAIADNGNCIYDGQVFTNLKNKGLSQEKCTTLKQNLGISEVLVESCLNEAIMVKIFNLKGQMVSSKSFKERLTITGEGMPKGIYFILLQDKNGKLLEKAFKAIF